MKGPLHQLIDHMNTGSGDLPPIVFATAMWLASESKPRLSTLSSDTTKSPNELLIGLGDFVFYSLMVGKSFLYADFMAAYLTMVALFFGLLVTILVLLSCDHALPALPIPIMFGLVTQIVCRVCVSPFAERINSLMIFI